MDGPEDDIDQAPPPARRERDEPSGSLAPVALGLGIAGLLLALVPFYGFFLALPLSIVAVVLGLTARGRSWESRTQATWGLATGGLGLLAVLAWVGVFAWGQFGFGSFTSQTSVEVGSGIEGPRPVEVAPHPGTTPDADEPTTVAPPPHDPDDLVTGLSGQAEVTIAGEQVTMELTRCALTEGMNGGVLLRGEGPDGRLAIARPDHLGGLVLDIEADDGPRGTYLGQPEGMSASSRGGGGGLGRDSRQFSLDGELRELHTGEVVEVSITATCAD